MLVAGSLALPAVLLAEDCNGNGVDDALDIGPNSPNFSSSSAASAEDKLVRKSLAADFDGDLNLDIATLFPPTWTENVCLFLGNGEGEFEFHECFLAGENLSDMIVADIDSNGVLDFIAVGERSGLFIVRHFGDGVFAPADSYTTGAAPKALMAADLNGDELIDIAFLDRRPPDPSDHLVSIFLGRGLGQRLEPTQVAAGGAARSLDAVDLDGDGRPELLVSVRPEKGGDILLILSYRDGSFVAQRRELERQIGPSVAADFDGDRVPDLAFSSAGTVGVLRGSGAGEFGELFVQEHSSFVRSLLATDLDADGRMDLVTIEEVFRNIDQVSLLLNRGSAGFEVQEFTIAGVPRKVIATDLDSDGRQEVVVTTRAPDALQILQSDADGRYEWISSQPLPGLTWDVTSADVNGDDSLDLVAAGDGLTVALNETVQATSKDLDRNRVPDECQLFHRGDANSDGSLDVSDAITILRFLFVAAVEPPCLEAADTNDDHVVNVTDPVAI